MQTVPTTPTLDRQAPAAGLTDGESAAIVPRLAADPTAGELMVGTGGARKLPFARVGAGKLGRYRTIHYFGGEDVPGLTLDRARCPLA